jgi:hypothetical protein
VRVVFVRWVVVLSATAAFIGGAAVAARAVGGGSGRQLAEIARKNSAATRPTTSAAPNATTTTRPPADSVTIAAVGDTELGNTPTLPASPSTYLAAVEAALAAPIVFGNLEGTLTDSTASKCRPTDTTTTHTQPTHTSLTATGPTTTAPHDCFAFRTPPSFAEVLRRAGFTVLNSANNHSYDVGTRGVADTSAALRSAGIAQAGLPGQVAKVSDGTTTVAFVDFAPYSNVNNMLDFATAKTLIQQARRDANIVVVYMHAGAEGSSAGHVTGQTESYVGEDRGNAKAFAHAAIDEGASLVLASGPHVLRGMEFYAGHLIAYSLGDFAGYHNFSAQGDLDLSAILHVTLDPHGAWVKGSVASLLLDGAGRPAVDPSGAAAGFVNQLSSADFGPNAALVGAGGAIAPPSL